METASIILLIIISGLLVIAAVVLLRALVPSSVQTPAMPAADGSLDTKSLSRHLLQAIRMQTISHQEKVQYKGEDFTYFHELLEMNFPLVHASLSREKVWEYSLLYTWKGRDESMKPILLMAHLDVVPAGPENGSAHPDLDGRIAEGYIWGKGTLDDKYAVLGILEAVENLLQEGCTPLRTIYLAFGHDEEMGGLGGAFHIASLLHARGVELEFVLDEGTPIINDILPGISRPVALVGIAEKANLYVELSVETGGGHPIMPPQDSAIGILSEVLDRLEKNRFPIRWELPVRKMLHALVPEMSFGNKILYANLWLFRRRVGKKLAASPWTNALIRTTMVPTVFEAGLGPKVLPSKAKAVMNLRLLPGDHVHEAIDRLKATANDPRVKIRPMERRITEHTFMSDTNSAGFRTIDRTIREVFPDVLVAPGLCLSETDSRYYSALTRSIFRFRPIRLRADNLQRYVHGSDEKISIEDYTQVVWFYKQLLLNSKSICGG
jgi:carboxypeptidase PM20D1